MSLINNAKAIKRQLLGAFLKAKLAMLYKSISIGSDFYALGDCHFSRGRNISIGDRFYMGRGCYLSADAIIGDDVMFASCVALVGGDHDLGDAKSKINSSGREAGVKPIVIENNVWVGHGAIILAGINIGENSVVGAGAVVTKDVPKSSIFAGNPARQIKNR